MVNDGLCVFSPLLPFAFLNVFQILFSTNVVTELLRFMTIPPEGDKDVCTKRYMQHTHETSFTEPRDDMMSHEDLQNQLAVSSGDHEYLHKANEMHQTAV